MNQTVKVGCDVISVSEVAASIERFGDRYLGRIFTDNERADCAGSTHQAQRFAARWAAKEAAVKVLRPAGDMLPWTSIEVVRHPFGAVDLRFHGHSAKLARQRRIAATSLSLSHQPDIAIAVVVAIQLTFEDFEEGRHMDKQQHCAREQHPRGGFS
ncbi:4'-phosphopantetheinyl transferase superfamily protein [Skermania sp. ID1734]|uniref:holo-ACP synthase n=1 Tax=Skermania sp. ID1734 TaxID=2597516 RepID=UPI00117E6C64|nr:4'-phosphopantetheinyl transferase superfamily protein [Skermania sp. ID1734]TSE00396.1 4'-phosphopantetheinyl transferase superfamily protein [Skermania sp. ID1734]